MLVGSLYSTRAVATGGVGVWCNTPGSAVGVLEIGALDEFWRRRCGIAETFLSMSGMKTVVARAASSASMAAISASRSLMMIRCGVSSMAIIDKVEALEELRVCPRGEGCGGDKGSGRAAGGSCRRRNEVANAVGAELRALGVGVRGGGGSPDGEAEVVVVCFVGRVGVGGSGGKAGRTSVFAMCGLYREVGLVGVRMCGWFWCWGGYCCWFCCCCSGCWWLLWWNVLRLTLLMIPVLVLVFALMRPFRCC